MNNAKNKGDIKFILFLLLAIGISLFARHFGLIGIDIVDGESMLPTLKDKEIHIASLLGTRERGDIIVVNNGTKGCVIKRIIGLPGETVEGKGNKIYINGELLVEDYIEDERNTKNFSFYYELADDEYFICGDNRDDSYDSRYYGPIKEADIRNELIFKR